MPYWMLLSLLFAAPFAFCGLNLGLLLSSPDLPTRRIYGPTWRARRSAPSP
jgi:hypothetical protein